MTFGGGKGSTVQTPQGAVEGGVTSINCGISLGMAKFWGPDNQRTMVAVTPVDDETSDIFHTVWLDREPGDDSEAVPAHMERRLKLAFNQFLADLEIGSTSATPIPLVSPRRGGGVAIWQNHLYHSVYSTMGVRMQPVAEQLFTIDDTGQLHLIGGRCMSCSSLRFPVGAACERCGSVEVEDELLPSTGALWTWTTQEFRPPSPPYRSDDVDDFRPFFIGYVALGGEVMVETRLTNCTAKSVAIGAHMRAVPLFVRKDENGDAVATYAFEPMEVAQ